MADRELIKIGFCVAYDWEYLINSLPLIYEQADKICLSLDKDRISWGGSKFHFDDEAFYQFVKEFDRDNKIDIYEDDFHLPMPKPMHNEVRQRKMIAERLGKGGWHIQLDTDEYFVDFKGFTAYLQQFTSDKPVNIICPWYTMYKETENGFLFIDFDDPKDIEYIPIASKHPHYEYGRSNGYFNVKTKYFILHQSWARNDQQILDKINNWGHKGDYDAHAYFRKWQTLNEGNYTEFINFHPAVPHVWSKLAFRKGNDIQTIINSFRKNPPFQISQKDLDKENSLWRSRFKAISLKAKKIFSNQ